jgi:hypothetical protein
MLAALIATRAPAPPPPPVLFYTNQLVAATTTFTCITICRRAAYITTSLPIKYTLSLSLPGQPAILDLLNLYYYRIINYQSSNANMIDMPVDLYLSNQIAAVIATVRILQGILATLPIVASSAGFLTQLQQQLATALAVLNSLAVIEN